MMLHVRDCPGTTFFGDICPFPWCRKVKHFLYHLISCQSPRQCGVCTPLDANLNMRRLRSLNDFRIRKLLDHSSYQYMQVKELHGVDWRKPNEKQKTRTNTSRGPVESLVHEAKQINANEELSPLPDRQSGSAGEHLLEAKIVGKDLLKPIGSLAFSSKVENLDRNTSASTKVESSKSVKEIIGSSNSCFENEKSPLDEANSTLQSGDSEGILQFHEFVIATGQSRKSVDNLNERNGSNVCATDSNLVQTSCIPTFGSNLSQPSTCNSVSVSCDNSVTPLVTESSSTSRIIHASATRLPDTAESATTPSSKDSGVDSETGRKSLVTDPKVDEEKTVQQPKRSLSSNECVSVKKLTEACQTNSRTQNVLSVQKSSHSEAGTETKVNSPDYKKEPSELRNDRLSSESLLLRVS